MYILEIEPLDLGEDIRAIGLELAEDDENHEPVRGVDAARIWSLVFPAVAGDQPWGLDFFSHLDRVREYCVNHTISFREPNPHAVIITAPSAPILEPFFERFEGETFGARAGGDVLNGDPAVEGELARHGVDAYHSAFPRYYFCAVCDFENGSLVLLTEKLWASEIIRRVRPVRAGQEVEVRLPA